MSGLLSRFRGGQDRRFDRKGDLAFAVRASVLEATKRQGPEAWARLEIDSARRVVPIWAAYHPATRLVDLLDDAGRALAGELPLERLAHQASELKTVIDDLIFEANGRNMARLYAGMAGVAAANAIVFGPPEPFLPELDADVDQWPASFLASIASAGAARWERPSGSSERRREFWDWYLTEAERADAGGATED